MNAGRLQELITALRKLPYFRALEVSVLENLARNATWREQATGDVLFLEGETLPGLYFVEFGWLKVVKSSLDGREQVLRFIGPGETFNEVSVFTNRPNPASAVALEAVGLWLLKRAVVTDLLRTNPDFAQSVIEGMAERLTDLVEIIADLSLRPVIGRLSRLLLADASDNVFRRPRWYTQAELAARLGTVPDVVQRALRILENEGLIDIQRDQIQIRDRVALEKRAE